MFNKVVIISSKKLYQFSISVFCDLSHSPHCNFWNTSIQSVADILDHLMRDWKNNRHPSSLFGCKCAFLCWSISGLNNTWVGKWEQKIAKLYPELLLDVPAPWTIREPSVSPGLNTCQPLKEKKKLKKIKRQAGVFYDSLQEAAALSLSQQSFSLFTFFSSLSLSVSHF